MKQERGFFIILISIELLIGNTALAQSLYTLRATGLGSLGVEPLSTVNPQAKKIEAPCVTPGSAMPPASRSIVQAMSKIDESAAIEAAEFSDVCLPENASTEALLATLKAKAAKAPKLKKQDGTLITEQDWVNLAMLARSLVGEISTTRKCDVDPAQSPYAKAVAKVILNRMDFAAKNKDDGLLIRKKMINDEQSQKYGPMVGVLLADGQFSAWKMKDPARQWAMCPARPGRKYQSKGRPDSSAGIGEFIAWQSAVRAATSVIFGNRDFRNQTSQVSAVFYTKGKAMHDDRAAGPYEKVIGASVSGHTIDNIDCLELWNVMSSKAWLAKKAGEAK